MAKRGAGLPGSALLLIPAGVWLVYVGVKDVPPVGGLREILRGRQPEGAARREAFESVGNVGSSVGGFLAGVAGTTPTGRLVTIHGIRVDSSIADAVASLVNGARPNLLTGGGYRSSRQQAQARAQNGCTCDDSSECCRTPTAPVGHSMHERGLAIDFSWNGALIRSRSSAGYRYLAAHAPAVGLKNLPSEPWHWSTNGK